jgi:hypothetical protein
VDPDPDPLLLRKSGSALNPTRNSGSVARNFVVASVMIITIIVATTKTGRTKTIATTPRFSLKATNLSASEGNSCNFTPFRFLYEPF